MILDRMSKLIRQNDDLTLAIHNWRRESERINIKIEVLRVEIERF